MTNTIQHRSSIAGRPRQVASVGLALAVVFVAAVVATPAAQAQRRFAVPARRAMTARFRSGARTGLSGGRRFLRRSRFLSYPYLYAPYFFPDYDSEPGTTEAPPPEVVVVEAAQASAQTPPPSPREPLLLELQGDRWVRVTSYSQWPVSAQSAQPESLSASSPPSVTARRSIAAAPIRKLPPAVLVFRDGRQEEVKNYTIIGPTLYTHTDYWSSGSWTRKVPITELDISATLKVNRERGVNFRLPSRPNEIVVRP